MYLYETDGQSEALVPMEALEGSTESLQLQNTGSDLLHLRFASKSMKKLLQYRGCMSFLAGPSKLRLLGLESFLIGEELLLFKTPYTIL